MLKRIQGLFRFEDLLVGTRFVWELQRFLRRPLSLEEAQNILRRRLEGREGDFLALARNAIYANPRSPYLELLRLAGCEYGDLELLIQREGLEGTLQTLFERGVYLTIDEFKGREAAIRGSASVSVDPRQLANPHSAVHLLMQTSGSRGPRQQVPIDLAYVRDIAVHGLLTDTARGASDWLRAIWVVPGGTALYYVVWYGAYGVYPARWFSQVDPGAVGLDPRYRWSGRALRFGSMLAGIRLPRSEHVPADAPLPIARWMADCLADGRTPQLGTFSSSAARLCLAALEAGIELSGARFFVSGEPLTEGLLRTMSRTGAEVYASYGSMEAGGIAYSCLQRDAPDDTHAMTDLHGLIQPGPSGRGSQLTTTALLLTSLRPTAPFILLNVSMGDQAELVRPTCGCPLEEFGWTTHLHTIRSFEKLTVGGMTFLDTDVIGVLEKELPARFGGRPTDYQLIEETAAGQPSLRLLVHPSVGPLDEKEVADTFLTMIGGGSGSKRVMELQWRQSGVLVVERRPPIATASGKILHLHQVRPEAVVPH